MTLSAQRSETGAPYTAAHRRLLDRLPQPALLADQHGIIVALNRPGLELVEASVESDVTGREIFTLLANPVQGEAAAASGRLPGESMVNSSRFEMVTLKGHRRTIEVLAVPLLTSPAGEFKLILGLARDVTDEIRARREQALLAAIVESSEDAIVSLSPDLRIMSWNKGAEKLLGYTAHEAIGASTTIYMPPEMRQWGEAFLKDLMGKLDRVHSFEVPCLRKDGSRVEVWTVCCGIRDANGRLLGMSAMHRDMTERKRAEQARDLLAAIVECSDDGIVSTGADGRITAWNRGAEKLFGYSAAEAIGKPFTITVPPDMREIAGAMVRELYEHPDRPNRVEVPCQRKDGSLVDVSLVAFAVRDHSGKVLGASAVHRDISERRRAQREQAMLAAIVESSQDAIISEGPDLTIRSWNAGAERLYGYSAHEAVGRPLTMLAPPDRVEELKQIIQRALKGEVIREYETLRRHKDGRLIEVSLSEAPVREANGRIAGVGAIERDISERVRARKLEAQMAAIVKSSTDAIYSLGPGHIIQTWNAGAERMFGYTAEEVIGRRSPTMLPDCHEQLDEMLRRVMDYGETVQFESKRRRKDGVILDVSVTASPIYDNSGMVGGLAVITRDISESKRYERELLRTQTELRARMRQQAALARLSRRALTRIEPGTLMAEAAALIAQTLSAQACAIAELTPDGKSLVRRDIADRGTPVELHADPYAEYILRAGEPVVVRNFAAEPRFQRGHLLAGPEAVSGLGVVIPDSKQPFGVVAVQCAQAREFSRDDVNFVQSVAFVLGQVLERRAAEEQLREARDQALQSVRAKTAFLANMSHEIRTPLNSIVGLSALLLETDLSPEQRDFAQTIRLSSDVLLETINNVLDFSKISSGKVALENTEFDPRVVFQSAADLLADAARKKNLELAVHLADDLPTVLRGDPGRLRQVIVNLIGNAIKFTAAGEVVLRVSLESAADTSVRLRFEVTDTGIGIAEDAQRRLFQPFHQADASTTRRFGGSGLGLAISAQIVELMGGKIGVSSQPGKGSTFWFTASLEKAALGADAPAKSVDLAGVRVLIVDDNATNRKLLRLQLQAQGMRVDAAAGGAEALAAMLREADVDPYRIALVDWQMPGMDGLELAARIKAAPGLAKIRLVMMSSAGPAPGNDPRGKLFDGWLTKPVKAAELSQRLAALCHPAQAAAPQPPVAPAPSKSITTAPAGKARILMAEDNPVNQKVATIQLKRLGYTVDVVGNGREALEAIKRTRYDLVLMDCQMPEMDGYEATGEIRKYQAGSPDHTPVIALTAFGLSGDREKCLEAGMDDYLAKPIRIEQLKEMLDRWLARAAADSC